MKRLFCVLVAAMLLLVGCSADQGGQVVATTLPVYEFTQRLCAGTDITVTRLITQDISCLHDYTLTVAQMRKLESAQVMVLSGGGLEEFLRDAVHCTQIDASMSLLDHEQAHAHTHEEAHDHTHAEDLHIWLSPAHAQIMAQNICNGLQVNFPQHAQIISDNLTKLTEDLQALQDYGESALQTLSCRELVTFHDGFSCLAESFDMTILKAVEEESGAEASAATLIELATIVNDNDLPAIFTEINGSSAAANVIAAETGASIYTLDMAISGDSYFDAMYYNINTLKEALQ